MSVEFWFMTNCNFNRDCNLTNERMMAVLSLRKRDATCKYRFPKISTIWWGGRTYFKRCKVIFMERFKREPWTKCIIRCWTFSQVFITEYLFSQSVIFYTCSPCTQSWLFIFYLFMSLYLFNIPGWSHLTPICCFRFRLSPELDWRGGAGVQHGWRSFTLSRALGGAVHASFCSTKGRHTASFLLVP